MSREDSFQLVPTHLDIYERADNRLSDLLNELVKIPKHEVSAGYNTPSTALERRARSSVAIFHISRALKARHRSGNCRMISSTKFHNSVHPCQRIHGQVGLQTQGRGDSL